jgi:antirestriction protein ArdC
MPARTEPQKADWSAILADAVAKPGVISDAYRRFWNYSVGNQLLALFQCFERKLEPGPIHTFVGWKELGRNVNKGEKALILCMPVTVKLRAKDAGDGVEIIETEDVPTARSHVPTKTIFVYRRHWFVLSQTVGAAYVPPDLPEWRELRAFDALGIERTAFDLLDGNVQGFARERKVAVSPIAALPHKTLFHEIAHVLLGHTTEGTQLVDDERIPRNLREVEAESVALICCELLGLSGAVESRGYIQHWLREESIPDKSAQKIFKAADWILKAGRPAPGGAVSK